VASEVWSPKWCPHVSGVYEREFDPDGRPEPTWVLLSCERCKEKHRVRCDSGAPRVWIQKYASVHLHRDQLDHVAFLASVEESKKG